MLKDFLAEKGISIYHAAKESGISYSTLNDIVNHKVDIANIKSGILHALASVLQISMDQLYDICSETIDVYDEEYGIGGYVSKKNKKYYLKFSYRNISYEYELCAIKQEATMFIKSIALWALEQHLSDIKMEEAYALCVKAKG
ncbi:MAG: helix-turn-helix transcriptional regulator [Eubacterium sp.]|nr:helix-turn-helix transcriptional regulator [Eubacterium sp.]